VTNASHQQKGMFWLAWRQTNQTRHLARASAGGILISTAQNKLW
jgi:hypothetical protein